MSPKRTFSVTYSTKDLFEVIPGNPPRIVPTFLNWRREETAKGVRYVAGLTDYRDKRDSPAEMAADWETGRKVRNRRGSLKHQDWIAIARKHDVKVTNLTGKKFSYGSAARLVRRELKLQDSVATVRQYLFRHKLDW